MRKSYLLLLIIPILFSCSSDTQEILPSPHLKTDDEQTYNKPMGYPSNESNTYDIAGQLYYRFTEDHLVAQYNPTSMADIINNVEYISSLDSDYLLLKPLDYSVPDSIYMMDKFENPLTVAQVVDSTSMGLIAKLSLTNFIDSLSILRDQQKEYVDLYNYIRNYENTIVTDSLMTVSDKKIILTMTSISRYGFYFASTHKKRKPRDKNWDLTMTGLIAGLEGCFVSTAKGIMMSVIIGIAFNRDY